LYPGREIRRAGRLSVAFFADSPHINLLQGGGEMFVWSFKADRRKICIILAIVLLVVTGVIILFRIRNAEPSAAPVGKKYSLSAATNEERVAFLSQFGWKVNADPLETKDVIIPQTFNAVYENYNKIQKEQGLDLKPYAGKTCKQWVYAVTNYPNNPDVRATLIVYNNQVVGGDLSTTALDGFMTGFFGEQPSHDTLTRSSSAASSKASSAPASSKGTSSGAAVSSAPAASKPAASSKASKSDQSAVEEAKPKASSTIPANAWPID